MPILKYLGANTLSFVSIGLGTCATNAVIDVPNNKYQSFLASVENQGSSLSDFVDPNSTAIFTGPIPGDGYLYANTPSTTSGTQILSGSGILHALIINKTVASAVITMYDGTSTSGTKIGTITLPGTLLAEGPVSAIYDVAFNTGLFVVVATGACDITWAVKPL